MKPETAFRTRYVDPFLKTLKNTVKFSIQQMSLNGHPDMLICVRGKFVALELKARGGRLEPLQEHFLNLIRSAGGLALVATPDNWPEIKDILLQLSKGEYRAKNS